MTLPYCERFITVESVRLRDDPSLCFLPVGLTVSRARGHIEGELQSAESNRHSIIVVTTQDADGCLAAFTELFLLLMFT